MGERHAKNGGGGEWLHPEGRGQKPRKRQIGLVDTKEKQAQETERKRQERGRKQREVGSGRLEEADLLAPGRLFADSHPKARVYLRAVL